MGLIEEDIKKVQRLGAINRDNNTLSRQVLIQLGSRNIKNLIMESLSLALAM